MDRPPPLSVLEGENRRAHRLPNGATIMIKGVGIYRGDDPLGRHIAPSLVLYGWPPGSDPGTDPYTYQRCWDIKTRRPWSDWKEFRFTRGRGTLANLAAEKE
ncbi:hypothetical protein LCGC14_0258390 [marine sediment metagenome]|uniref:Uncharacterized protein n=1 Tax=marine sediment metagenome TaxID=412755 RepID=A0A0F9U708_9ZZZZ